VFGVEAGYALTPWLDAALDVTTAAFPAPRTTGGLLSPSAGLRVSVPATSTRPYLQLDAGPGFTGTLMRPMFRVYAGLELQASNAIALGPRVGYAHLFQTNGPGDSTDASFLFLGIALSFWPGGRQHLQPVVQVRREHTVEVHEVVRELPPAPPSDALNELLDRAVPASRVELLAPVLFRFDSDQLEPLGVAMPHELEQRPDIQRLEIQGYADQRGSVDYNQALSRRRAERVQEWLVTHGVDPSRLTIAAEGASSPVEAASSEAAREQNRRVVFRVLRAEGDR
jgi:outer membrane protein OmpA-like peptidoglycan-associated protein